MKSLTKNLKPKIKKFFFSVDAQSFEGLNSSLAQLMAELCHRKDMCKLKKQIKNKQKLMDLIESFF